MLVCFVSFGVTCFFVFVFLFFFFFFFFFFFQAEDGIRDADVTGVQTCALPISEWLDNTDLPRSEGGFIAADEFCRAKGMERVYVAGDIGSYPGPEWMAKQAHQADLQAVAVARNIAADIKGETVLRPFTTELACIIDSLDSGMLVYRRGNRKLVLPRFKLLPWAKERFERSYISKLL